MRKNISIFFLLVFTLLIGKTDAVTLTQKMGDGYIYQTLDAGDKVTLNFVNQQNKYFTNWTVESANVNFDTSSNPVTFTMPNSNVTVKANYKTSLEDSYTIVYNANGGVGVTTTQTVKAGASISLSPNGFARDMFTFGGWSTTIDGDIAYLNKDTITPNKNLTLYAVWIEDSQVASNVVKIGDYVSYNPIVSNYIVPATYSGHTADQTFNPTTTTSWKVFNINKDDGTVELISTESIGDLTLKGKTGFQYAIQTMQGLADAYVNTNYVTSARALGYSEKGLTPYQVGQYNNTGGTSNSNSFPYTDSQHTTDKTILDTYPRLVQYTGSVWVASRYTSSYNYLRILSNTGDISNSSYLYRSSSDYSVTNGFRPIVKLDPRTEIIGGEGTSETPYKIASFATLETCAINYSPNGGTGVMDTDMAPKGSQTELSSNLYAKQYHTFKGWATSPSGSVVYTDSQKITVNENITLYAVWEKTTFLISFNANGGTGTMTTQEIKKATSTALTSNIFTRQYYTFKGWSTTTTGSVVYTDGQSIVVTQDMTLYAVWERTKYTITFNSNGGSGNMAAQIGEAGKTMTLTANTFTKSGYDFKGWATSSTANTSYNNSQSFTPTKSMTLYAVWGHTITFNGNGATGGSTSAQIVKDNTAETLKANGFTRTGYSFAGWSTSANGSKVYNNRGSITLTEDETLYAQWKIVLSYDANGGSGAPSAQGSTTFGTTALANYTFTISSTAPTKRGGTFKGWATTSNATSATYTSGKTIKITNDTTLYAVWGTACYCCSSTSTGYTKYNHNYCYTCYKKTICPTELYCSYHNSEYSGCSVHSCTGGCWDHGSDSTLTYYCSDCEVWYCNDCYMSSAYGSEHISCDCCYDCYSYCSCSGVYYCDTCGTYYCSVDPCEHYSE